MEHAIYSIGVFALILCSSFFSVAEMSFMMASPVTLRHWAEEGNKKAAKAVDMLDDANIVLTTINIGDTVVNLAAIVLGTIYFIKYYSHQGIIIGILILFLSVLLVGEMIPRMVAQHYENRMFCRVAGLLRVLVILFKPLTFVLCRSGHIIIDRAGEDIEDEYVEEELLNMLDEAESGGGLESHESDLIRSAINFEELTVKDILRPRVKVVAIDDEMDVRDVLDVFANTGYSRLPVYHESIDDIIGVLHLKDVFNTMIDVSLSEYRSLIQPVGFVFMQTKASKLLLTLQKTQSHMVIITDEYGGTAGIVTLEDILEELVGDIWDEHDQVDDSAVVVLAPNVYQMDASMDIDDFFEFFGLDFEDYEDDIEASSLGGWVNDLLEHLASPGESVAVSPFVITVEEVNKGHIGKVRVVHEPNKVEKKDE